MRIAVLTDIHANILALEAVIKDIRVQNIDNVVFLGDLVMTGPRPQEAFDALFLLEPVIWIKGNTDDWFSDINESYIPKDEREKFFKTLTLWAENRIDTKVKKQLHEKPITADYSIENMNIIFCHGSPFSYSQAIHYEMEKKELEILASQLKSPIIICGHTHVRFSMNYKGIVIQNFGAVSIPSNDFCKDARYGIIQIENTGAVGYINRECSYDVNKFFKDMKQLQYPGMEFIKGKFGV